MKKQIRYFVGDFETVTEENTSEQESTEVWASAIVELYSEKVSVLHSIEETYDFIDYLSRKSDIILYYHNLKFDGSFWLDYLMKHTDLKQAFDSDYKRIPEKDMENNTYSYVITEFGQWYCIILKLNNHIISIRDSLKLLPFSVKQIGKSFKTEHQKLDMEYKGHRYAGCDITDDELDYIKNDVLVIKEALEKTFEEGHRKLTIGSCCMQEFKRTLNKSDYQEYFPDLYDESISNEEEYYQHINNYIQYKTIGEYIRASYRGGWCYLAEGKERKVYHNGVTADVNSLYPSMMHSISGNRYPIGYPIYEWHGEIPDEILYDDTLYYFIRFRTRFKLKKGFLPFIQIKNSICYDGTECLKTSDVYDKKSGKYYSFYTAPDGKIEKAQPEFIMTMTDYILFREHYILYDTEYISGMAFVTRIGLFDDYINKYRKIKMESKGAKRQLAKLFLNNLYGKFAASTNSSHKIGFPYKDRIAFQNVKENEKQPGYIPIGSAITSYSRNFTIRTAQKNYHGKGKRGFIYADTDSIHCDLSADELTGLNVSDNEFCCWKLESFWDTAYFLRAKTYIEHITHENQIPIEAQYYNIKCAGMPEPSKKIFDKGLQDGVYSLGDFDYGLQLEGKLLPKRIKGGIVLVDTLYTLRR